MTTIDGPVLAAATALSPEPVESVSAAAAGGNSRVFRVEAGGRRFALKAYPSRAADPRDRLGHEFEGYALLHAHGLGDRVPAPVARDDGGAFALYGWIDGEQIGTAGPAEIDDAVAFVADLWRLAHRAPPKELRPAVEASFAIADTIRDARRRLAIFAASPLPDPSPASLLATVETALSRAGAAAESRLGEGIDRILDPERRTLSPSDFGFHNALRLDDARIAYVDFEYFGLDDPARLVGDFLLHPGMSMAVAEAERFLAGTDAVFRDWPGFRDRLAAHLPAMALRWCLILINEYVPGHRRSEDAGAAGRRAVLERQLAKAEAMLEAAAAALASGAEGAIAARRGRTG